MEKSNWKKRVADIFITAFTAALIAALQSVLANLLDHRIVTASPEMAGAWGMALKGAIEYKRHYFS